MTEEQIKQTQAGEYRHSSFSDRTQERHERCMAKQAAREARRLARAQRPRLDWSFEVKFGEKVYTFNWRWHLAEPQAQDVEEVETVTPESKTETE